MSVPDAARRGPGLTWRDCTQSPPTPQSPAFMKPAPTTREARPAPASLRKLPIGLGVLLGALGLVALYADAIRTRFLNDDYLFLEDVRSRPFAVALTELGALGNYWRPLSRQIYFEALASIGGGDPLVFHVFNFLLFLAALALLFDLLRRLVTPPGAMIGTLGFALLPLHRVNLTWVSCSQDLMALLGTLGTIALYRRGRMAFAMLAYLGALASKEAALPLPLAIFAWELLIERRDWRRAARSAAPFAVLAVAWHVIAQAIVSFRGAPAFLHFDLVHFVAGYVHMIQSTLGLETMTGLFPALARNGPSIAAFVLLAPLALWYEMATRRSAAAATESDSNTTTRGSRAAAEAPPALRPPARPALLFALAWFAAFGVVTGPVASTWSAYYYTTAAVGGAILLALALRRGDRWTWILTVAVLLWWHAASTAVPVFATKEDPWGKTSHLTSHYFERGAALSDTLASQISRLVPRPERGSRFFFATLPANAGFQMGNGALVRQLYRDTTLGSFFYTQFSETTAADRPVRFLYWDGAQLRDLYPHQRNLFFQVGTDLLLLDRPWGAAHAFRRGLLAGGDRMDHLYWLGWAYLWSRDRPKAEATWKQFGAVEDSLYWSAHLRAAHNALDRGDSLEARRHLIRAIEYGIGRPEGHATLGDLLLEERPKYATLEHKVASWLKPNDWMARRSLALSLAAARLDDQARKEFEALEPLYPEWRSDSVVVRTRRVIEARTPRPGS